MLEKKGVSIERLTQRQHRRRHNAVFYDVQKFEIRKFSKCCLVKRVKPDMFGSQFVPWEYTIITNSCIMLFCIICIFFGTICLNNIRYKQIIVSHTQSCNKIWTLHYYVTIVNKSGSVHTHFFLLSTSFNVCFLRAPGWWGWHVPIVSYDI